MPTLDEIDPSVRALIPEIDLACLLDEDEFDPGLLLHLEHNALFALPSPETPAWLLAAVTANPGTWQARLCRAMHDRPETYWSIAYCGTCSGGYANKRKRERAARLQTAVLPGFEEIGAAFQLHSPCSNRDFSWLRRQIYRLERHGRLIRRREKRLDLRQPRGYDWMSCLYPAEDCWDGSTRCENSRDI